MCAELWSPSMFVHLHVLICPALHPCLHTLSLHAATLIQNQIKSDGNWIKFRFILI